MEDAAMSARPHMSVPKRAKLLFYNMSVAHSRKWARGFTFIVFFLALAILATFLFREKNFVAFVSAWVMFALVFILVVFDVRRFVGNLASQDSE